MWISHHWCQVLAIGQTNEALVSVPARSPWPWVPGGSPCSHGKWAPDWGNHQPGSPVGRCDSRADWRIQTLTSLAATGSSFCCPHQKDCPIQIQMRRSETLKEPQTIRVQSHKLRYSEVPVLNRSLILSDHWRMASQRPAKEINWNTWKHT